MEQIRLIARRSDFSLGIRVLAVKTEGQKHFIPKKIVWEEAPELMSIEPCTVIYLDQQRAQVLIDDLWDAGIRPTQGIGSAGAMAATQKHLEDMRTLVFKKGEPNG